MDIWEKIKLKLRTLGLTSVYRILEILEKASIVTGVRQEDRRLYYFFCTIDNHNSHHHHFICTACHGVQEVRQCHFDMMYKFIEKELGCKPVSHTLEFEGLCKECRQLK